MSAQDNSDAHPPEFTDEALALKFAEAHANKLRYVAYRKTWFYYDGQRWRADETKVARDFARKICRVAAKQCNDPKIGKQLASATSSSSIETLAMVDRRIAASNDQWDVDPWLLNTPAGVVDLRTGAVRPHSASDYMTKMTAVAPGGDCPRWKNHLLRIMNGDVELVAYLQRVFGYALTGITREHALFFAYGTGANGKSVTLNTVASILANYHRTAPIETFTASQTDRHPTELAGLQGARFVTAIETEDGRAWAEFRIKSVTGGDPISARYMRQDFFEFVPCFKLFIAGNYKPTLRQVDEAIRRRLHLIPFTVTIPVQERDETLPEQLKAEWPGILAWMIEGCLQWQKIGLAPPAAVKDATAEYLQSEDSIKTWFTDECELDPQAKGRTCELYASWKQWAERSGERVLSEKWLAEALAARGFKKYRTSSARGFEGLRVKPRNSSNGKHP